VNGHPWPIYDLRLSSERLELRLPTDNELLELLDIALAGIHDPSEQPFGIGWTDAPSPRLEHSFLQFHWGSRANWTPNDWTLNLGVWADGRLVGTQDIHAKEFATLRSVATGSWLGRPFQGQGIGKEMRNAVLALAFDHLGARWATSSAFRENVASLGVSRALGYTDDGLDLAAPRGEARLLLRNRMSAEIWRSRQRPIVDVQGLDRCLGLFGAE
jgi:RimJ/RimL family protein N-acetyltransferase